MVVGRNECENIVIGSGPAGVSCAMALLSAGKKVTMIDVGLTLEDGRSKSIEALRSVPNGQWRSDPAALFLKEGLAADLSGVPLKLSYGSDFPYRHIDGSTRLHCQDAYTNYSLAAGGLSNVWGSSILPYADADLEKWPIKVNQLAAHYAAVLQEMPIAGREDDLASQFPLYAKPHDIGLSRQATRLLQSLEKNKKSLRKSGMHFGKSRIAVHEKKEASCVECGLCMYGCPYGLIYSSADTLEKLKRSENFDYYPNTYVVKVEETGSTVLVHCKDVRTDLDVEFRASRIFVAAGVISTATIMLRSFEAYDREITMLDSAYFLQPSMSMAETSGVNNERLHTLVQAFIEVMDTNISKHTVHLQVYTYNELYRQAMQKTLGPLRGLIPENVMLGRLYLLQGFMHSDESPVALCSLKKNSDGEVFNVRGGGGGSARQVLKRLQRKLLLTSRLTGLFPLLPLMRMGEPGRSFHSGGTFPMSENPGEMETDLLGRPKGLNRVHIVDASVFPSIPATTITLTAMANAHRIGTSVAQLPL